MVQGANPPVLVNDNGGPHAMTVALHHHASCAWIPQQAAKQSRVNGLMASQLATMLVVRIKSGEQTTVLYDVEGTVPYGIVKRIEGTAVTIEAAFQPFLFYNLF